MYRLSIVVLAACGAAPQHPRPTQGVIAGLARDHDSGDPIGKATIRLYTAGKPSPHSVSSDGTGHYALDHLPPGEYAVNAQFAGQVLDIEHVHVAAGEPTYVDLVFTLGHPDLITVDYNDVKLGRIDRYKPTHLSAGAGLIEGTINDQSTLGRIAGASISVWGPGDGPATATQLGVSDDQGRFRFDVTPGVYTVSAYYNVSGRGQIEVRRAAIEVGGAEAVVVPLWLEALQ